MTDTIQTIKQSARHFFSGTLLSRATGMMREMALAYVFGAAAPLAYFFVAFRLAQLLRRLFGEGALQSAFIPEFEALRAKSVERASLFFQHLTVLLSFFLFIVIAIAALALSIFQQNEISSLTLIMLPSLFFICLYGLNSSLLQCEKKFFIPSAAPAIFNLVWIAAVLLLKGMPAAQAMPWLAIAVVIACFFQWLLTVPQTISFFKKEKFFSINSFKNPDIYALMKPLGLGILGVGATQINNAVDSLFALAAEPGGPAYLWFAGRLQQLPLALFGIAIGGAILPPLSRALKTNDQAKYHYFLKEGLLQTCLFMIPLSVSLFVLGDTCIQLIYGRGDFKPGDVIQTTYCLWGYALGLIPSALIIVLAPAFYAQSNYALPAIASFIGLCLNFILNSIFIYIFGWGATSVAIATSISAWVNLIMMGRKFFNKEAGPSFAPFWQKTMGITLSSFVAVWGTYQFRLAIQEAPFFADALLATKSPIAQLALLVPQTAVFAILFASLYFAIRCLSKN